MRGSHQNPKNPFNPARYIRFVQLNGSQRCFQDIYSENIDFFCTLSILLLPESAM